MTADNGAERWTACERLDGLFAPFSVLPHEQIEEIFIRQIAGFAYFIVDGKISQFCRHFKAYCRQNEAFCRHVFAPIKSDGKKGQFCRHIFEKCRQKQANLPPHFIEMFGKASNQSGNMHNRTNTPLLFPHFPIADKMSSLQRAWTGV